jgi:hypothetical protein
MRYGLEDEKGAGNIVNSIEGLKLVKRRYWMRG